MNNVCTTQVNNLIIEGYEGDYVFESIRKNNDFYEDSLLKKWIPYVKASRVILDIGANLGNHTLFFATNTEAEQIYSFEPCTVNYERLCNNITNNNLQGVHPIKKGVGACKGYSSINNFSEDNLGATSLNTEVSDSGDIEIIDIDTFVEQYKLSQVEFIKIDTEGFEEQVLEGMKQIIELFHPDLWIEVTEKTCINVINALQRKDYFIADIEGFNILFLYRERHKEIKEIALDEVLAQTFSHLTRVNRYYSNYSTAKKWLEAKDAKLNNTQKALETKTSKLNDVEKNLQEKNAELDATKKTFDEKVQQHEVEVTELKKELDAVTQKAIEAKEVLEQNEKFINSLNEAINSFQNENGMLEDIIVKYVASADEQEKVMLRAKLAIQRLQRENQALREENAMYKRRWDKISSKWYGRLALKIYYNLRVRNILK